LAVTNRSWQGNDDGSYRLLCNLTLFDASLSRFFGRTWTSPAMSITPAQINHDGTLSLPLSLDVGLLVPQLDRDIHAILELVLTPEAAQNDTSAISLGWMAIQLPSHRTALDTYGQNPMTSMTSVTKRSLQSGSPRALLIAVGSMDEVLAEVAGLSSNAGKSPKHV
jgi:hypothetical protein